MSQVLDKLKGGDLRSIGRAEKVVQDILEDPALFAEVFEGMLDDDPQVRMRSADAVENNSHTTNIIIRQMANINDATNAL